MAQQSHAWMCGQIGRAWGNDGFGDVVPREEVCLAAEQHELGMVDWDLEPGLDVQTGLPAPVTRLDLDTHLPLRLHGPRRLAGQSRYAALIASLHHVSFYDGPGRLGRMRRPGRQIEDYLRRSATFQAQLRATLPASDAEIERNWRLVRAWDGLSHALLLGRAPCTVPGVPAADDATVDVRLAKRDGEHTLDPWPFAEDRLAVRSEGRLLSEPSGDLETLHAALARAPWVELSYTLAPA